MSSQAIENAKQMAEWIDDKKGKDIRILDIHALSSIADCFILTNGSSTTQVQAIADHIEEKAEEKGLSLLRKEGYQNGRWILLDYNEVVVHIFHEEEQEIYKLERLWRDAEPVKFIPS